jgi:methylglutaconyl-CoA hydratase
MSEYVSVEIENALARVTLNRPEVHNAFNQDMIAQLHEAFIKLAVNDDVHIIVLSGAGKSFSAGADMNWMKAAAGYSEEENFQDALALANMLKSLYELPQLTIAAVHGAAMGGGMGLVACCDLVIAAADTKFALSEVKLGLIPATISPYVMRAIGKRQARRYFQTGEFIPAADALNIGLIHEIAADAAAVAQLVEDKIALALRNGPQAMRAAKALVDDISGAGVIADTELHDTAIRIAKIRSGEEAQEGLSAFLEKRKPSWQQS